MEALPVDFRQNWILMVRSESLQTGTATSPRILLPSADLQRVFTIGMTQHDSYPGAHPNAIEYMQWDAGQNNFRFHEIVLDAIPALGDVVDPGPPAVLRFPARSRGVSMDDHEVLRLPLHAECAQPRNDAGDRWHSAGLGEVQVQAQLGYLRQLGRHAPIQPRSDLSRLGGGGGVPKDLQPMDLADQ